MTRGLVDPDASRAITRTMALRKVAQPEDVAAQVVVLASDALSGHVTGQVVTVAGGMEGRTIHETERGPMSGRPQSRSVTPDSVLPYDMEGRTRPLAPATTTRRARARISCAWSPAR